MELVSKADVAREMAYRAANCAVELQQEAGYFVHRRIRLELHIGFLLPSLASILSVFPAMID